MKTLLFTSSLFLSVLLFLFTACDKDDEEIKDSPYNVIELNMEDLRFADLPNLATINEAKGEFDFKKYKETDSLFIIFPKVNVNGSAHQLILYPTKLPKDMPVRGDMFLFSG
ncbi:hypothetical protein [Macellibacteroides fermentans]|uniref:hypothetical protein n=1 Tax=Macellibacteroides fermentans TaxID=879969 RepID=UPI00406BF384